MIDGGARESGGSLKLPLLALNGPPRAVARCWKKMELGGGTALLAVNLGPSGRILEGGGGGGRSGKQRYSGVILM